MTALKRLQVGEIDRGDLPALNAFFTFALGTRTPPEVVSRLVAGTVSGRLLAVRNESQLLALLPFEVYADSSATVGEPLFHPDVGEGIADCLRACAGKIGELGADVIHVALPLDSPAQSGFIEAGFTRGPVMLRMEGPVLSGVEAPRASWVLLAEAGPVRFGRAFYATLEGSLDFPELPVSRDPVAFVRALEQRGPHEPEDFVLLCHDGTDAGVLVTARNNTLLELCYMGLAPACRGKGMGRVLMARVVERALAHSAEGIGLNVDAHNTPAIALYGRFGLSEKRAVRVIFRVEKKN